MAFRPQWELASSDDSAFLISRDILEIAKNENVQPLAIMTCEELGNTLVMCQETCAKVQQTVAATTEPIAVHFLQATIGYSTNDCTVYLSKSLPSLRFLSLAAALVTSMDSPQAGASLHELLRDSRMCKTLLPTKGQLQTLLASVEERCQCARLTDNVVEWQIMIEQSGMFPSSPPMALRILSEQRFNLLPPPYGICKLVEAFRQWGCPDNVPTVRVTICATSCASWVIVFVQWYMGSPPSLLM